MLRMLLPGMVSRCTACLCTMNGFMGLYSMSWLIDVMMGGMKQDEIISIVDD